MSAVFLKILNMSITAGWMILAVLLARLLLKKAPKWIVSLFWALVAIRLICPLSLESAFSLIPSRETVPAQIAEYQKPEINTGITIVNETVNPILANTFAAEPAARANPLQIAIPIAAGIWLAGIAVLLLYALYSYLKLKKSVSASVSLEEGIMACDEIKEPFILGVVHPVIYVPSFMEKSKETLSYVLLHESAHLKRRDHWWKPIGYFLLAVYWFHPLCWIAYLLFCRDIEMACDEKVIRDMDRDHMAAYSQALLDLSFPGKKIAACPLAFGEVGVKQRVKGVLHYKKPTFWIILIAVIVCVLLVLCLMTDPSSERSLFGKKGETMDIAQSDPLDADPADLHVTMTAVITEIISDSRMLVRSTSASGDLISVPIRYLPDSPKPQVGDTVEIECSNQMLLSYPAQLSKIYSMKVIKQAAPTVIVTAKTAYANWTEDGLIRTECLNPGIMVVSSEGQFPEGHLPVYKFDTVDDLERFKEIFQNILTLDQGYDEVPSFHEVTAAYDEDFFAGHAVIAAYVAANSGSYRYALQDILFEGSFFCMDVVQTNNPEEFTDDMAGWFVLAEIPDADFKDAVFFDARFLGIANP